MPTKEPPPPFEDDVPSSRYDADDSQPQRRPDSLIPDVVPPPTSFYPNGPSFPPRLPRRSDSLASSPAYQTAPFPPSDRDFSRWRYTDSPPPRDPSPSFQESPGLPSMPHASEYLPNRRPLIDFVTNEWQNRRSYSVSGSSLSASDTDSDFFSHDWDRNTLPRAFPRWLRSVRKNPPVIPRKVQRLLIFLVVVITLSWVGFARWIRPAWKEQAALEAGIEAALRKDDFVPGANLPIEFDDMIQVKNLAKEHLPRNGRKGRLVFVGDIHGCKHELLELLGKVEFDRKHDHLVVTGDMINKGPDTPGVVDILRDMNASCVRGNHEDRVLLARADIKSKPSRWQKVEDEESFERATMSKSEARARHTARQLSDEQAAWLAQCPVILRVGRVPEMGKVDVVHAGLVPGVKLTHQDPYQVMNMRSMDPETRVPSENRDAGSEWDKVWSHFQDNMPLEERGTVVYGHDSKRGLNIQQWVKGLDSGCVNGGSLTALVVGEGGKQEVVSVKCAEGNRDGQAVESEDYESEVRKKETEMNAHKGKFWVETDPS